MLYYASFFPFLGISFELADSLIGFLAYDTEYFPENLGEFFLVGLAFVLLLTLIK